MAVTPSVKHLQINKARSTMFIIIIAATVVTIFSLFATKALISQGAYQRRVLAEKNKAVNQLEQNFETSKDLIKKYQIFAEQDPNLLGQTSTIDNARIFQDNPVIVLDALPSKYDFPALTTSIEKILSGRNVAIRSISGSDESASNPDEAKANPEPLAINFGFEGRTTYAIAKDLIKDFERSIRPFDITVLELNGSDGSLRVTATATTYYQPAKNLEIKATKEVR